MSEYYSLEEAARRLGKSEDQIREMVTNGELRAFRDAGSFKFRKADVDALAPSAPAETAEAAEPEPKLAEAEEQPEKDELLFLIDEEGTGADPDDLTLIGESDEAAALALEEPEQMSSEEIGLAEEKEEVDDEALTAVMEPEVSAGAKAPPVDLFAEAQEEMAAGEEEAPAAEAVPLGRAARLRQMQAAAQYRSPLMDVLLAIAFVALLFTGVVVYNSFMAGAKPLLEWLGK